MKLFSLLALCLMISYTSNAQQQPNIIFIIADDLGYGNLTSYNPSHKVPTPNIDQLAREGTKFTRFYSGSTVCAPSRCALMTGKHMGHAYIRGNSREPLRPQDTTLAQYLQASGYSTGMFGKWGLGEEGTVGAPEHKGFDAFYGYLNQTHAHHYYTDHLFEIQNGKSVSVPLDSTEYTDELIMQKALGFIKDNKDKPFFVYLPLTIPHAELHVPAPYMKRFQHEDGSSKLGPETPFVSKGGSYHSQEQPHAAFAGMITKLDEDVARVLALVKELGLDDNTYIFFTSDNGPHQEGGADPDFFDSNGPLRGIKRDLYEGGIRVPLLVRAPGKVPAGAVRDDIWAFWDIMPTLCRLAGTRPPENIDGISFTPALTGKVQKTKHPWLYWQFYERQYYKEAIVQGHWKMVRLKPKDGPETVELYDLSNDVGEQHNLAAQQTTKVNELLAIARKAKTPAENPAFVWPGTE